MPHVLSAGGTVLSTRISLERGLSCSTGGGTHHAGPDYGSGYCLINDLAVAAMNLLQNDPDFKVLIIDLDVHQVRLGNWSKSLHKPCFSLV